MTFAIGFALALILSSVLVPVMVRLAPALGLVDQPDKRKVHVKAIPRAGGVAIVFAFFAPVFLWSVDLGSYAALLTGALIIAFFGFLDDRHDLSYQWKFMAQILAVAVFLAGNVEITKTPFLGLGDQLPWLSYPILALFILGVTNAVNLSDGLDGLAAGSSLLSFAFVALLSYVAGDYALAMMSVCVMGALTGFLRFNTHPATIFMGDAGSQFLGYMAACLAVLVTQSENCAASPMLAVMIVGLPILDTLMVIVLRLRSGVSPFSPDQRHLHHQLLRAGLQHYQAVAGVYLFGFILMLLAYLIRYQNDGLILMSYLVFCALVLLTLFGLQRANLVSLETEGSQIDRRNPFFRRFDWFYHHGTTLVSLALGLSIFALIIVGGPGSSSWALPSMLASGAFIVAWWLMPTNPTISRTAVYLASAAAVYTSMYSLAIELPGWQSFTILDSLLLILALVLAVTIRTTRKAQFRLDNQDLLILLLLVIAPLLTGEGGDSSGTGAIVRLVVLLYAAEYVVSRVANPRILRTAVSLAWSIYFINGWVIA